MEHQNLSTIGSTSVIAWNGPDGVEYWLGGEEWSHDIALAQRYGAGQVMKWLGWHHRRHTNARPVQVPGQYQLMRWKDVGWVCLNTGNEEMTVHRVRMVNGNEDWFFTQDHKRTLIAKIGVDTEDHYQIEIEGDQITKVILVAGDIVDEDFTALMIPDDSNLKYMFEFESKPVEELEVA